MNQLYKKPKQYWNKVFKKHQAEKPLKAQTGKTVLDNALDWLNEDVTSILDFGCGNGTFLFLCELRGSESFVGIDFSEEAIQLSKRRAKLMNCDYQFIQGDIKVLSDFEDNSFDAVILSNIVDNLTEEDMQQLLQEVHRLLKLHGKILIKINPYITKDQFQSYEIKEIDGDLLDDGLLLLNKTTNDWKDVFENWFIIKDIDTVFYSEHDVTNRLFLLENK